MKIKKILILSIILLITNINYLESKNYYASDVFFSKYYEIPEKLEKGFYIEHEKINNIDKFSLFKDSELIKSRTEEIINNTKKIIHYDNENIKKTEETYNDLNNKIKEIIYGKKGKLVLQTINYFYKNNELIYQELKIMNQKPKLIYYEKDFDGKLFKISGANFQIWNYGIENELKSTYFDVNNATTKAISYDRNTRNINSAIFINNALKSKESNIYQNENEILSTIIEGNTKIFSKYLNSNLMREEVFLDNKLKKTSIYLYNSSGIIISEEQIINDGKKVYKTKTEYDYDSENRLKAKRMYENGIISMETTYLSDDEYEQKLYDEGFPIIKIKYKGENMIEEKIINANDKTK